MARPVSHQKILQDLLSLVHEHLFESQSGMDAETDLFEAGMESMGIMQLIMQIEERFGIVVSDGEVTRQNFRSVAALAAMVERLGTFGE